MEAHAALAEHLAALEVGAQPVAAGAWRMELEAAGLPLTVDLSVRGPLVRVSAAVLPPALIDPHQLLYWNQQAPLVCFAEGSDGHLLVCGEIPLAALDPDLLDRFLGLVHASATRARRFAIRSAP